MIDLNEKNIYFVKVYMHMWPFIRNKMYVQLTKYILRNQE